MSTQELIQKYQQEILDGNLLPQRTAEMIAELSALLSNLNEEMLRTEVEYNKILIDFLKSEKTSASAKIMAGITPEYIAMKTARNTKDACVELVRSLKYLARSQEEEFKASSNL